MGKWLKKNRAFFTYISALLICLVALWLLYYFFGKSLIKAMYEQKSVFCFNVRKIDFESPSQEYILLMAKKMLVIFSSFLGIFILLYFSKNFFKKILSKLFKNKSAYEIEKQIFSLVILFGCVWVCYHSWIKESFQLLPRYSIEKIMDFTASPPCRHRVLFVLLARLIKMIFPMVSIMKSYLYSQLIALLLTFYAIKKLAELFIKKELAFIAQLLLVLMLIPTFGYYTFYDIGIIFFYTISLLFLYKRQFLAYFVSFTIGIFNHEIMLLLIFVYTAIYFDSNMKKIKFWSYLFLQIALFAAARKTLKLADCYYYIQVLQVYDYGKVWFNIHWFLYRHESLRNWIYTLVPWYCIAFFGIKNAPKYLRRSLILFPLLFAEVVVAGQLNELRHFNPFIPIAIALILCFISSILSKETALEA